MSDVPKSMSELTPAERRIAEALAAARMEGRLDIAKVVGADELEGALRSAIDLESLRPIPTDPFLRRLAQSAHATVTMLEETIKAHSAYYDRMSGNPEPAPPSRRPILEWQVGTPFPDRRVLTRVDGPHHTEAAIAEPGYCSIYDEENVLVTKPGTSLAESMDHAWDELVERGWFGATIDGPKPRYSVNATESVPKRAPARGDDPPRTPS